LGIANPGFWLLGAASELAYLVWLAGNQRFQKTVAGARQLGAHAQWQQTVHAAVQRLSKDSQRRYARLLEQCQAIVGISTVLEHGLGSLDDLRGRSLNQLLTIFLRLLTSREIIADNLDRVRRPELDADIARLEGELAELQDPHEEPLRRSLEGTLAIQRRRLENLDQAASTLRVIDAELERIEQQTKLLREESAVSGKPHELSARLDAVTAAMGETSRWMDQQPALLGTLAGDELSGALSRLPEPPKVTEGA
jgi:DNA repair exonuclease SbcCD ATPase subunit